MAKDKQIKAKKTDNTVNTVNTVKVTISQCLNELKLLDKKVTKKIREASFVGVSVNSKTLNNFDEAKATASLQSINDMIARREMIKGAINASNGETKVSIAGKKYTVAEAIVTKDTMKYKARLLQSLKEGFSNATYKLDDVNENVAMALDNQIKGIEDKKTVKAISDSYLESRIAKLSDPIGIVTVTEALENEIMDFENEVDYVLSTSNATVTISI